MRINLTVHGRFHAFDLAQVLTRRGHDVRVFTNYPASVAQEFGLTRAQVSSFVVHGILSRAAWKLRAYAPWLYPEAQLHHMFGNWAMRALQRETWDIVHPWSGVSEELLRQRAPKANYLLMRGSAHIRTSDAASPAPLQERLARG